MVFASKIKKIYPYLKGILLIAGFLWTLDADILPDRRFTILYFLLAYAIISMVFGWILRKQFFETDKLYFVSQFSDAAMIALVVRLTGGLNSDFYLAFFPIVALAAVYCVRIYTIFGALWYGLCYLLSVTSFSFTADQWKTVILRMVFIWSVGLVTYSVAHLMRSSEKKLLKTLDILNERTWELESSQTQISDIYETTRVLSGILDLEHLLGEILRVAQRIFHLKTCRIFLSSEAGDCLYLYAGLENGNRHIFEVPIPYKRDPENEVVKNQGSVINIPKLSSQEKDPGQIDMPLISRGNVIGVMQVAPEAGKISSNKDRRFLMVFAGAAAVAVDNSLLHKKTEELTIIDALTELYNFRYFRNKLADELRRADRYRQKLSVLMMDLDHFKEINDRFGHQTGNVILREVSAIIRHCVRDIDVVARYGGEEFVVILPQTDEGEASVIAERIRDSIEKFLFADSQGRREIRMTISIGIAMYPEGVHSLDQLLEKVDKALYKAKADGRNVVKIAEKSVKRTADIS